MDKVYSNFSNILKDLKPGQYKLLKIKIQDELLHISFKTTEILLKGKRLKIISFQNIKNELEENELDSWQKIIRVLTHEIMNSVAPIVSATSTLSSFFKNKKKSKACRDITDKVVSDTVAGLNAISLRGEGLLEFVNKYRSLTLLPKPDFRKIKLNELVSNIGLLLRNEFDSMNISFNQIIEPDNMEITFDSKMLEQVLLNLLKNSVQALKLTTNKKINVSCKQENDKNIIIVSDNGCGINEENIEKVFIPFYTTKETGSGIGLSLSRQIMRLHGGTISIRSKLDIETVVRLEF